MQSNVACGVHSTRTPHKQTHGPVTRLTTLSTQEGAHAVDAIVRIHWTAHASNKVFQHNMCASSRESITKSTDVPLGEPSQFLETKPECTGGDGGNDTEIASQYQTFRVDTRYMRGRTLTDQSTSILASQSVRRDALIYIFINSRVLYEPRDVQHVAPGARGRLRPPACSGRFVPDFQA